MAMGAGNQRANRAFGVFAFSILQRGFSIYTCV